MRCLMSRLADIMSFIAIAVNDCVNWYIFKWKVTFRLVVLGIDFHVIPIIS